MGQRRRDREWEKPTTTRHVWVSQDGLQVPPIQGFVVDWKRHSYRWSALTILILFDDNGDPVLVQRWIPAQRLTPVLSNPNDGRPLRIIE